MGKSKWKCAVIMRFTSVGLMSQEENDPVRLHKQANSLFDAGKLKEAKELFVKAAELYRKVQNYFDSTTMYYKAGECAYNEKEFEEAVGLFDKSAELSFQKGFDRFAVSALEFARDGYKALGNKAKVKELEKKIKEAKAKLEETF